MSQVSNLGKIHLITLREDVVIFLKKVITFRDEFIIHNDLNSIWDKEIKILIIDVSMLESISPFIWLKLEELNNSAIFLEPEGISVELKTFIENRFKHIVPYPISKSVLLKYLDNLYLEFKKNNNLSLINDFEGLTKTESFYGNLVGTSKAIRAVRTMFEKVALIDTPVLLLGETGTGKTTGAEIIHSLSKRKEKELVKLSIATLSDTLAGSAFFGTAAGAYTDATAKTGVFKIADKGTLFLDEIGLASPTIQAMLLNVLNSGEINKIGSNTVEKVDVRLITATNENLELLSKSGTFRSDLFFRINDNIIKMPSLRDRKEDIPQIVSTHLIGKNRSISSNAMDKILQYDWPGNIRQLNKCLDRALDIFDKEVITADDLVF